MRIVGIPLICFSIALIISGVAVTGGTAQASLPHETFFFEGSPTPEDVAAWSALPGSRSYTIEADDPTGGTLQPLSALRGADRIQVEMQYYPNAADLSAWKDLASRGIQLVLLNKAGLPTEEEVQRLNTAGFDHCLFVIDYYPDPDEAQNLGKLQCQVSVTFATAAYPKYEDKPGLAAIPDSVPLLFASDYWPSYTHMDVFNMLPQPKLLRVVGMLPPSEQLQYLRGIHHLQNVQLSTEFDPQASDWSAFDGLPLVWTSQNHVPPQETLEAFSRSRSRSLRKLIIDSDTPWTSEEQSRIEKSPLPVEWIHQAPYARSGERWR